MNETVPYLNLAPRLKRLLQLWDPSDYLRLLYWIFFFPQALRWYLENFAAPDHRKARGKDLWTAIMRDIALRHLISQALILCLVTPFVLAWLMEKAGLPIDWSGVAAGMVLGVAFGMAWCVILNISAGVAAGTVLGVVFGMAGGVAFGMTGGMAGIMAGGMDVFMAGRMAQVLTVSIILTTAGLVALGVALCIAFGVIGGVADTMAGLVAFSIIFGVGLCLSIGVYLGTAAGMALVIAAEALILRPEVWAMGTLYFAFFAFPGHVARCTPLPLPGLRRHLKEWLLADWPTGVHNLNEMLAYSIQFIPVVQALNDALAEHTPEVLLAMVDEVAKDPYDWNLLRFASAPLVNGLIKETIEGSIILPKRLERHLEARYSMELRLNTSARAACAGFWYLHEGQSLQAVQAFSVVRSLPNGEEMYLLSQALLQAQAAKDFYTLANLADQATFRQATTSPSEFASILHPTTWQALEHLQRAASEAHAVQESVSQAARSKALNRAIGEIVAVQEMNGKLPQTERGLVDTIAANWQKALLSVAGEVWQVTILKPVEDPYVVGDPVMREGLVGREDILRRLEELWLGTTSPPSVVLYGHRRMGKTSILRNIDSSLGSEVRLAYINLLALGEAPGGVSDLLLAMADKIRVVFPVLPQPDENAFDRHPYRAFELFLEQVRAELGSLRLIIALDEFEQLEEWMRSERVPRDLLKVLRGYMQMDEHIAFAFAGLHTLEEMTANYFEPFFASVLTIPVSFLSRDATFQVLTNPSMEDFPLDYSREALERIWQLTGGQPYLVQLIGHHLVSRFNRLTFEQGSPAEREFNVSDVEAVIGDPEFYGQGRYYFTGVWGQAGQGVAGQQKVLKALAAFTYGLSLNQLTAYFGEENTPELKSAIYALLRHDVISEKDVHWSYAVELMRRWVKDFG